MTVCVAMICEDGATIIGASDRMLTAGNVQFNPPASKTYQLTVSIALMVAGDMFIQAEIVAKIREKIDAALQAQETPQWLKVKDVAAMYVDSWYEIKAQRGENEFLRPLGLNFETFVARQKELSPDLVNSLSTELIGKALPGTEAIVTGIDTSGGHIYSIQNGVLNCHDAAGFASVGAGWYHASSHLMFSKHGKAANLARSLLLTYTAKKRAEVAPGVGPDTDMFAVKGIGSYFVIGDHVINEFQETYMSSVSAHADVEQEAERQATEYVEKITQVPDQTGPEEQQSTFTAAAVGDIQDVEPKAPRAAETSAH